MNKAVHSKTTSMRPSTFEGYKTSIANFKIKADRADMGR